MRYKELFITVSVLTITLPTTVEGKVLTQREYPTENVRGVLVLHWEQAHFIRRDKLKEQVFEIRIKDARWMERYLPIRSQDTMFSVPLYCVSAVGYEDRKRLGGTGRSTFVFTKVTSTASIDAKSECAAGLTGN